MAIQTTNITVLVSAPKKGNWANKQILSFNRLRNILDTYSFVNKGICKQNILAMVWVKISCAMCIQVKCTGKWRHTGLLASPLNAFNFVFFDSVTNMY